MAPRLIVGCGLVWALSFCGEPPAPKVDRVRLDVLPLGSVAWRRWDERGDASGKPILLYHYNRRSYWCQRFARRVLEDPLIVREIARVVFPVAVESDTRPDLFERYGLGGWPSLSVIDPQKGWLTGTRYIEADDLERLMRRVHTIYDIPGRLDDVERNRVRLDARRKVEPEGFETPGSVSLEAFVDSVAGQTTQGLSAEALLLLSDAGRLDSLAIVRLFDGVLQNPDGLFVHARLTSDGNLRDEEVTLSHNAGLLGAAAGLAMETGDDVWRGHAQRLADGLDATLGVEDDEGPFYAAGLAGFVTPDSLFAPALYGDGTRPLDARWIARWNAQAVSAAIAARRVGVRVSDRWRSILDRLMGLYDDRGAPIGREDRLADAALTARALLDAHDLESSAGHLAASERIASRAWEVFVAPMSKSEGEVRVQDDQTAIDRHEPGAIAVLAEVFVRLGVLTGKDVHRNRAKQILARWIPRTYSQAAGAGTLGRALLKYVETGP